LGKQKTAIGKLLLQDCINLFMFVRICYFFLEKSIWFFQFDIFISQTLQKLAKKDGRTPPNVKKLSVFIQSIL